MVITIGSINMSASTTPDSSFTQERNNKTPTLKLSLKGQPKSLPNLFESMNINEESKKPKPHSQKNAVVRSRVKSFEGKKVALNPVLTNIDGLKLTKDSPPLSSLRISNTDKDLKKSEKAISSNNKRQSQLYHELKETKEKVSASRVGYFSRNAFEAKMGSDYGPPSLKISNTDEVWAKMEKTQERSNRNPTLKLSLKGHQSLPNLFESLNLQEGKTKPYSQNKVVAR